ncbi:hypothetical protein BZA77DRAFT_310742 [Pyronema omphalodes]|nr:hypothetical protein BZA77DRAFT_310742 [Pyronema omphalodes]
MNVLSFIFFLRFVFFCTNVGVRVMLQTSNLATTVLFFLLLQVAVTASIMLCSIHSSATLLGDGFHSLPSSMGFTSGCVGAFGLSTQQATVGSGGHGNGNGNGMALKMDADDTRIQSKKTEDIGHWTLDGREGSDTACAIYLLSELHTLDQYHGNYPSVVTQLCVSRCRCRCTIVPAFAHISRRLIGWPTHIYSMSSFVHIHSYGFPSIF